MQHIVIPMAQVLHVMVNPGDAKINEDDTVMFCAIEDSLHILVGNFTGIDTAERLDEIIRRNL